MAATGFEQVFEGVLLSPRPYGLLLDAAPALVLPGDRWRGGIRFAALGCDGLHRVGLDFCGPESLSATGSAIESPVFEAFAILAAETCSDLAVDEAWLNERLDERFNSMVSEQVAAELMNGTVTDATPSLRDTADIVTSSAAGAENVLGRIEQGLADRLHGAQGMIHMSPEMLSWFDRFGAVKVNGSQLITRTGHIIVADSGYKGDPPTGTNASGSTQWVYGSGPVGVHLGPARRQGFSQPDRSRNLVTARLIAEAVFAFDPCPVVAAEFTIPT